jgi:type IV pilus assembly protein PilW
VNGCGMRRSPITRRGACGNGLVELLIAMTLALLVIGAAVAAFLKGRDAHAAAEAVAQLQETARYALGVIESDLRMSGYLGLHGHGGVIANLDGPLADAGGDAVQFDGCAPLWTTNLDEPVGGWDQAEGRYGLGADCAANGGWRASTDGLVLRRASADRIPQTVGSLAAYSRHALIATGHATGLVFVGDAVGTVPPGYAVSDPAEGTPPSEIRRLLVHAYYISRSSSEGAGFPGLRRKRLVAGPAVQDEEVIPGIDDLQVQYGVDGDRDGSADRWLDAGEVASGRSVVAARIWLRARARERDAAWDDTTRYTYANQDERLPAGERPYRRLVIMKTVHLRNPATP